MKKILVVVATVGVLAGCNLCFDCGGDTSVKALKTDMLVSPANIGETPSFSWAMKSNRKGASQLAYRLKVYEGVDNPKLIWDTKEVKCNKSVGVSYNGPALKSAEKYVWEVSVLDDSGEWLEPQKGFFETGLMKTSDWNGSVWISPATPKGMMDTAAFRKVIKNDKDIEEAYWSVTGLGVFEAYVNGQPVSRKSCMGELVRDILKPGFTHAFKCRHSFTYDVTHLLNTDEGDENVFSALVSQGWWRDQPNGKRGKESAFRAQLILRYDDGTQARFGTDTTWVSKYAGPIVTAGIFIGETYDARIDTDWMKGGKTDGSWAASKVNTEFSGEIRPFVGLPTRFREDLILSPTEIYVTKGVEGANDKQFGKAIVTRRYKDGDVVRLDAGEQLVVDFAQNAAAVPEFEVEGVAGTLMRVRLAEMLNENMGLKSRGNDGPEGSVYVLNLRGAKDTARVNYTLVDGVQTYRPEHTFFGYRYAEFTATAPVKIKKIRSVPVTSISNKRYELGTLKTDNELVNKLVSNVLWGQYSNYLSVPTDCPQRNERLGWTADTQVFTKAASYNANVYGFLVKWMDDMVDSQHKNGTYPSVAPLAQYGNEGERHGWADAGVIVPYVLWQQFGDTKVIRRNWDSMKKYMQFLDETKFASKGALTWQYSDWLSYEKMESNSLQASATKQWSKNATPEAQTYWKYLGGCYWLWDSRLMAKMAEAINNKADANKYQEMAARALAYMRENFLAKDGQLIELFRDMQTPALFALKLGIAKDEKSAKIIRDGLLKNIKDHGDCLQTGFLGTSILMDTITYEANAPEMAYTLLLQRKNPSWLYSVDQGATTIWERWNSYTKANGFGPVGMNSFNHYAYGAVLSWMYGTMAGIQEDPEQPGFKHIILAPIPDKRIGKVDCTYNSMYGEISSSWKYNANGSWTWNFTIPANTTATVKVPNGETKEYIAGSYEVTVK